MLEDGQGRSPAHVPSRNPGYRFQLSFLVATMKAVIRAALEDTRFRTVMGLWLQRMRCLLRWHSLFFSVIMPPVCIWGWGWHGTLTGPQPGTATAVATTAASKAQGRELQQSASLQSCALPVQRLKWWGQEEVLPFCQPILMPVQCKRREALC